jgi:hypothetical protein
VSVAGIAALTAMGSSLREMFTTVSSKLNGAVRTANHYGLFMYQSRCAPAQGGACRPGPSKRPGSVNDGAAVRSSTFPKRKGGTTGRPVRLRTEASRVGAAQPRTTGMSGAMTQ